MKRVINNQAFTLIEFIFYSAGIVFFTAAAMRVFSMTGAFTAQAEAYTWMLCQEGVACALLRRDCRQARDIREQAGRLHITQEYFDHAWNIRTRRVEYFCKQHRLFRKVCLTGKATRGSCVAQSIATCLLEVKDVPRIILTTTRGRDIVIPLNNKGTS